MKNFRTIAAAALAATVATSGITATANAAAPTEVGTENCQVERVEGDAAYVWIDDEWFKINNDSNFFENVGNAAQYTGSSNKKAGYDLADDTSISVVNPRTSTACYTEVSGTQLFGDKKDELTPSWATQWYGGTIALAVGAILGGIIAAYNAAVYNGLIPHALDPIFR